MRVLRKFEPWEEMFIRLTHPVETTTTIAKYLGRKNGSIREFVCRKLQTKKIDKIQIKIGDKFGILEVKSFVGLNKKRSKIWNCLCECGKSMTAVTNTLTSGHSKSCGCQRLKTVSKNIFLKLKIFPLSFSDLIDQICFAIHSNTSAPTKEIK